MPEPRKVILYIAASLDSYIATRDHHLDWLFSVEGQGDNGYAEFLDTVDTILMGRVTYDWLMEHEKGAFPYQGKECYVFSRSALESDANVRYVSEDVGPFIRRLLVHPGKNIWLVGGGGLIQAFLQEGLVDELMLTVAPRLLGDGIPLFQDKAFHANLILKRIRQYNQFAELDYEIVK